MGTRRLSKSLLAALALGCSSPSVAAAPSGPAAASLETTAPLAPWGIARMRSCGWSGIFDLSVSDDRILACHGTVFSRADGRLIEQRPRGLEADDEYVAPSSDAPACAGASLVGRLGGRAACLVDDHLFVEGGEGRRLALASDSRFVGDRLLVVDGEGLAIFDTIDRIRRLPGERLAILDATDAVVLLADEQRVIRVELDTLTIETVLDHPAFLGVIAGDEILLISDRELLWLARGAHEPPPIRAIATPPGLVAMSAGDDDGAPVWIGGGGMMNRARDEVAAFVRIRPLAEPDEEAWMSHFVELSSPDTLQVTVAVSDASELADLDDDTWARALARRFVPSGPGDDPRFARTTSGRVLWDHQYTGGCARVHVDLMVREVGGVLERWTVESGERPALRRRVAAILGPIPRDARRLAVERTVPLDPSIARVGP